MDIKKIILTFVILGNYSSLVQSITECESKTDNQSIVEYINALKTEEESIWSELQKLNISHERCCQLKKQYSEEYKIDCENFIDSLTKQGPLSNELLSLINEVLEDFNISPNDIKIISTDLKSINCPILIAGDSYICIDEELINLFSDNIKQFVIAHELQHIIHKDDSTRFVIEKILNQQEFTLSHPIVKLAKFQEKRSDILAACKSQSYAQAEIDYMKILQRTETTKNLVETCPTAKERLAFGKEVLRRINIDYRA